MYFKHFCLEEDHGSKRITINIKVTNIHITILPDLDCFNVLDFVACYLTEVEPVLIVFCPLGCHVFCCPLVL
jgi:hypothetical protein